MKLDKPSKKTIVTPQEKEEKSKRPRVKPKTIFDSSPPSTPEKPKKGEAKMSTPRPKFSGELNMISSIFDAIAGALNEEYPPSYI